MRRQLDWDALVDDGMFVVEVDGREVADIGRGAMVGERGAPEDRIRSATWRATTRGRVAEASPQQLLPDGLHALAGTRRRDEPGAIDVQVDRARAGLAW